MKKNSLSAFICSYGLNKNLTKVEVQLVGPLLPILEANTTEDTDFVLVEHGEGHLSLYQYQSMFPIKTGIPMNLTRLADFDTIQILWLR
jgi:hypothetical protein